MTVYLPMTAISNHAAERTLTHHLALQHLTLQSHRMTSFHNTVTKCNYALALHYGLSSLNPTSLSRNRGYMGGIWGVYGGVYGWYMGCIWDVYGGYMGV